MKIYVPDLRAQAGDVFTHLRVLARGLRRPARLADFRGVHASQRKADAQIHVGQRPAYGIPALKHRYVGLQGGIERRIALGRKLHVGQGVGKVGCPARRS